MLWFGFWMVAGLVAFVLRVVGIDMLQRGRRYKVVAAEHIGTTQTEANVTASRRNPLPAMQFCNGHSSMLPKPPPAQIHGCAYKASKPAG